MRAIVILAVGVLAACRSEPPSAVGRFDRPSGLAVIPRADESQLTREDLLVVDSEAQGVKIIQYAGNSLVFVPAPVVFFPLVISAPGFPTEITVPVQESVDHAYVLATGASAIHLIDVSPLGFGDPPSRGNALVRTIDTLELAPGLIPTDIQIVGTSGEGVDLLAVAFEGVSAEDQLMILSVDAEGQEIVGTATIAASPRRISVRGLGSDDVRVLLSSGTSSITEVALDLAAENKVRGVREVFVGGPTEDVLDAGPQGAFAIRTDRPRVVHLVPGVDGLVRSSAPDQSPFTPIDERGTASARGSIDVHPSPIGAAAVGFVPSLTEPSPRFTVVFYTGNNDVRVSTSSRTFARTDGELPVLMLAHADGLASFVVVEDDTARLATVLDAGVARVNASEPLTLEAIDPDAGNAVIGACSGGIVCPTSTSAIECPPSIVRHPVASYTNYRATYRGALARGQAFRLEPLDDTSTRFLLSDPTGLSFGSRMVVPGDRVLLQMQSQNCTNLAAPLERIGTATVTAVSGSSLEIAFDDPFERVEDCPNQENEPALSRRYEVYPGDEVMVLTTQSLENILEVLDRVPVVSGPNGSTVDITERLAVRISSSVPFSCTEGTGRATCVNDIDCGPGRTCTVVGVAGCPRICAEGCAPDVPACIDGLVGRSCTFVDFEAFPTVPMVVPTSQVINDNALPSIAPDSAVFSTLDYGGSRFGTFTISFPGSRVVVGLALMEGGYQLFHIR